MREGLIKFEVFTERHWGWLAVGAFWVALITSVFLTGCIQSPTAKLVPMEPQEPDSIAWAGPATLNAQKADGTLVGGIVEMEEYWAYDDPCGLIMILRHGCDGTVTFQLKLANDSTDRIVYAFTPAYGTFGLYKGQRGVYLWHKIPVQRLQECKQRQAINGSYCNYDIVDAFQSDFDVLPLADSARVAAIRKAVGK